MAFDQLRTALARTLIIGISSKCFGLINQVIGLYLMSITLGAGGTASTLIVISVVSWFNLVPLGAQIGLPTMLITSRTEPGAQRVVLASGCLLFGVTGLLCPIAIGFSILAASTIHWQLHRFATPMLFGAVMNGLYISTAPAEHWLTANRRIATFSTFNLLGSCLSLMLSIIGWHYKQGVTFFVIASFSSITSPGCFLYVWLLATEWKLQLVCFFAAFRVIPQLIKSGSAGFTFQLANTIRTHGIISAMAIRGSPADIVAIGSILRFCVLGISGISFLFAPIMSEAAHEVDQHNVIGYTKLRRHVLIGDAAMAIVVIGVMCVGGRELLTRWLGDKVHFTFYMAVGCGGLLATWIWEFTLFYLASGAGIRHRTGVTLLCANTVAVLVALAIWAMGGGAWTLLPLILGSIFGASMLQRTSYSLRTTV